MSVLPKIVSCSLILIIALCSNAKAETGFASWYSRASCQKEFGDDWDGKTASMEVFDDEKLTCANWDYNSFGDFLLVTNLKNGRAIVVEVTDRGPAKRLYRQGRIIDLSRKAFSVLASLSQGIIEVKIEEVEQCQSTRKRRPCKTPTTP